MIDDQYIQQIQTVLQQLAALNQSGDLSAMPLPLLSVAIEEFRTCCEKLLLVHQADLKINQQLQEKLENTNQELEVAYEELQSTNEELEASNEELQSTNQELYSTNNELQWMNEELQSTVEDLQTTNEELYTTIEQLETTNNQLQSTKDKLETTITQLLWSTDELNQVKAFLESILDSLGDGVVVVNSNLDIQIWNHKSEELWGLWFDEVKGKQFMKLDIGLPVEQLSEPIWNCLAGKSKASVVTLLARNSRGKNIQCQITCKPLVGKAKEIHGVILLMQEKELVQISDLRASRPQS